MKTKLSSRNLLTELEQPDYRPILAEFTPRAFAKSSLIYTPGHDENLVFIVKQGRVRIFLTFEDKEFSLAILEKGDIYTTHTRAYVFALEACELITMPTAKFHGLMQNYPIFSRTIISGLGELLKQSFSIIDSLVFKDVTQRIVDFFIYEARANGKSDPRGITVSLDLTMEQLASIVGSSRQTVSTIIGQLQRAGVMRKAERGTYLIPNLEILKSFPHA